MNATNKQARRAELNGRIRQLRQSLFSDSNRDFAQRIGEAEQNLCNVCEPEAGRNASLALVTKIAEALPEVDLRWLLTGKGDMLSQASRGRGSRSDMMRVILSQQDTIRRLADMLGRKGGRA